jgi:hypothetical protein
MVKKRYIRYNYLLVYCPYKNGVDNVIEKNFIVCSN